MNIPSLTEAKIKNMAEKKIFRRGLDYFKTDAVFDIRLSGKTVEAFVEGSHRHPYKIKIELENNNIKGRPFCSCPFAEDSDVCKHIVAALLVIAKTPEAVRKTKSLSDLIEGLDKKNLKQLLKTLVKEERRLLLPLVEDFVDSLPAAKNGKKPSASKSQTKNGGEAARQMRAVANIISVGAEPYSCDYYYDYYHGDDMSPGDEAVEEILDLIEDARRLISKGRGEEAIEKLRGIAEGYVRGWKTLNDPCDPDAPFDELEDSLSEAVLSSKISENTKQSLQKSVTGWISRLKDIEYPFAGTVLALKEGWSDEALVKRLEGKKQPEKNEKTNPKSIPLPFMGKMQPEKNGKTNPSNAYSGRESPEKRLSKIRLKILQREKRFQEYMNLAWAEGLVMEFISMKIETGCFQEALKAAKERLRKGGQIFEVFEKLKKAKALKEALEMGRVGLKFTDSSNTLSDQVSALASKSGDHQLAFLAAQKAFLDHPSLDRYNRITYLSKRAGDAYMRKAKADCLKTLRDEKNLYSDLEKAKILIQENLFDEAVRDSARFDKETCLFVMKKGLDHNPQWVTQEALRRAKAVIDEGKAKYYGGAIDWLRQAKKACLKKGGTKSWAKVLAKIRADYGRRPKLMSLLDEAFSDKPPLRRKAVSKRSFI